MNKTVYVTQTQAMGWTDDELEQAHAMYRAIGMFAPPGSIERKAWEIVQSEVIRREKQAQKSSWDRIRSQLSGQDGTT